MLLKLALKSLFTRRLTVLLTLFSLTISMALMLGIEHIREQAKESFSRTIAGTDLIIGARSGQLNLLLYSVFRIGDPTNNISWQSAERIRQSKWVKWAVPISLGDSFRGYRVVGTTQGYFEHYQYGQQQTLSFADGQAFDKVLDIVLGAEVASKLNLKVGDKLTLSHGVGQTSFQHHDKFPFTITGVLTATGTPVDKAVYTSLIGLEVIHTGFDDEAAAGKQLATKDLADTSQWQPKTVTAMYVGLSSKLAMFQLQRQVNTDPREALMAIIPGVALSQLWQMLGMFEQLLTIITYLVLIAALVGMSTMLLASVNERQAEIVLLRVLGASPFTIGGLILFEAFIILVSSMLAALALIQLVLRMAQSWLSEHYGLFISSQIATDNTFYLLGLSALACLLLSLMPAISLYRKAVI